jgi:release factor glutamine methyltransferase
VKVDQRHRPEFAQRLESPVHTLALPLAPSLALPSQPESAGGAPPASQQPGQSQRWTVLEVVRWTTGRFAQRNLASPRLDAEVLVAHALALTRVQLYVQYDRPLDAAELAAIRELVKRRQAGESVAYITGKKEFFGIELTVDARVLVPRPDTETLVDESLARLTEGARPDPARALRIADVGTGSGAVAISIAKTLAKTVEKSTAKAAEKPPAPEIIASDLSADALVVARANAERHGAAITFVTGDLDAPLQPLAPFDLIAANLPYIPSADIAGLEPEVRGEPHLALDGGADGLELVRRRVAATPGLLRAGGALALEIGAGQADATAALLTAAGFIDIRKRRDLGEIERVVSGVKP